jgi:hypothetical protein
MVSPHQGGLASAGQAKQRGQRMEKIFSLNFILTQIYKRSRLFLGDAEILL